MRARPANATIARRLAGYFTPLRWILAVALVAVAVRAATEPILAVLLAPLVDESRGSSVDLERIYPLLRLLMLLGLAQAIADFSGNFCFDYAAQKVLFVLRRDLFAKIHQLSLSFYEGERTGGLMSRATNDLNLLQTRLTVELTRLARCPLTILLLIAGMLYQSVALTLVAFGTAAVMVPLLNAAGRRMRRHTAQVQATLADLSARLQESISGMRVIQCFGAGPQEVERFEAENLETRRAMMRTVRVRAFVEPTVHVTGLAGLLLLGVLGGWLLYRDGSIELGRFVSVLTGLMLMTTNFKQFGRARVAAEELLTAADRVFELLDAPVTVADAPAAGELGSVEGRVTFERVSFAYQQGEPVLCDIDLELAPGETVAVVGPSGAGKSTLANLIPRLYDPTAGAVRLDGHDLREVTLASLRRHLGIVPQETVLFRGSIGFNIAFGRPGASAGEIARAAEVANAAGFIAELPDGYQTEVGERGAKLSGGQAQRIAIARAVLRDPRVLILDEATSSLDSESEALVQEALERLMAGRTTLMIAHRLSTILRADRIVVLEHGRIVATGRHEELLRLPGHYQRAYLLQSRQTG